MEPAKGRIEAINSKMNRAGRVYWALRFTDYATGKSVVGTVCGGESNIGGIRLYWTTPGSWDRSLILTVQELPIREFDRLTKEWPYAGSEPEKLAAFIRRGLEVDGARGGSGGADMRTTRTIYRRTFKALKYHDGSVERNALNYRFITSEYDPSYKYVGEVRENGVIVLSTMFKTKREATAWVALGLTTPPNGSG